MLIALDIVFVVVAVVPKTEYMEQLVFAGKHLDLFYVELAVAVANDKSFAAVANN